MKNKFRAIKNIILGRPVMYRIRYRTTPDDDLSQLHIEVTNALIAECTHIGRVNIGKNHA